ncbi:hypothetical protein A2824_01735 [Candidatus Nomurabacteria bacterium RIFCSPHIGHO2_01_FULL_42_16]|uniref:Recombination protein RecR n=1 Tax=Candidatus Nomurabacteria bacterium RIFCSPHIGHO2_01_FULL_42_16 TaxID=1801743 RepID=A0A1F6VKJ4_9BACT|nr:MAG: hypothetical protein A2824_01735 [Candidatus Nomurabacteria bacterium RIFCSPHIGHO2_01_FULL_42_16]
MSLIEKLSQYFKKFPGIGERQAARFVYFLLNEKPADVKEFIQTVVDLKKNIGQCAYCFRFAELNEKVCTWCRNHGDAKILVVVEKEAGLETLQKSNLAAKYFILGNLPRQKELIEKIKKEDISEIILAFSLTPQAEYNEGILRQALSPIITQKKIKISSLGRGISTGLELEYSDPETIQNALKNRQ